MTEYYTVKRIDNSRLARVAEPAQLQEFWRRVLAGAAMAACLLFYAWQHFECIQLHYQVEQLESSRAKAAELNQQLHLEVATLRSPARVDAIARQQLGLTVPVPGQVAPAEEPAGAVLAQARAPLQSSRP
jgi:cell division protein FtsL